MPPNTPPLDVDLNENPLCVELTVVVAEVDVVLDLVKLKADNVDADVVLAGDETNAAGGGAAAALASPLPLDSVFSFCEYLVSISCKCFL